MRNLIRIAEPSARFRHAQCVEDARDGLTLFGPLDEGKIYGIRFGVIGTQASIVGFKKWVDRLQRPISCNPALPSRPPFPGFEAAFQIPWKPTPGFEIVLDEKDIDKAIYQSDRHQRVYKAVDLFSERIIRAERDEDAEVDIWFVLIPDRVRQHCRPNSTVSADLRIDSELSVSPKEAAAAGEQPFLLAAANIAAEPYQFEPNFHNQLKARLLSSEILTQVIQDHTTSAAETWTEREKKSMERMQSQIAWNIATATFYKAGGRPWKLGAIRPGVCYVGIVFKQDQRNRDVRNACCAAQMFLDSGDGIVFKGAVGPWYNPARGDYHLTQKAAKELMDLAVASYSQKFSKPPDELFIHGKVRFNDDEWAGFLSACDKTTNLVGVTIAEGDRFKLFSRGRTPVLRGIASVIEDRHAYLWTRGFIPRLQTYPGLEVPNPLYISIARGAEDIQVVLEDVLALTKLNYNACNYGDGLPVTLKFADAVGEILTAGPIAKTPPLPFKHYI
jgi:hypothetical protein